VPPLHESRGTRESSVHFRLRSKTLPSFQKYFVNLSSTLRSSTSTNQNNIALASLATMPFAVDHEGWGYESHLPLLYEFLSRETPSPHFVRDGLTFLQREFSRVLNEVCQRMMSNSECLDMPSAVFQYYLEFEMWATFCKNSLCLS
jgi:hypothetical protein